MIIFPFNTGCLQSMDVSAPPGNIIGRVEQEWSICYPSFAIKNQNNETVLRIEGPLCTFSLCGDVEFKVNVAHFYQFIINTILWWSKF